MALVNYTGKNVFGFIPPEGDIVRLLPGINEMDDNVLKVMKTNQLFKTRIDCGIIQIMSEKVDKDGKRPIAEMVQNMSKIIDTKLLRKIIETDGRDPVVAAAKDQLDKIKNPSKDRVEAQNEHFS